MSFSLTSLFVWKALTAPVGPMRDDVPLPEETLSSWVSPRSEPPPMMYIPARFFPAEPLYSAS